MKKEIIYLILGAIFSVFLIRFDLQNGFEFQNIKINYSLFDFAANSSTEKFPTTQIIGYFFFFIFLYSIKKYLRNFRIIIFWIFLIGLLIGLHFESYAIADNYRNEFKGTHLRIGNLLTIFGIIILLTSKNEKKDLKN